MTAGTSCWSGVAVLLVTFFAESVGSQFEAVEVWICHVVIVTKCTFIDFHTFNIGGLHTIVGF